MGELEIPDLSALGVGGTATGAGALALYWTFGPSIKAVGNAFGEWTEYRVRNLLRLGDRIAARTGEGAPADGQTIHPRVVKQLIEEASWIDDDLHQEYLAGLFIASRSPQGKSDDGAYYARLVAGLTASQVRLHYGIYQAYYDTIPADGHIKNFGGTVEDRRSMAIVASNEAYRAMAAGEETDAWGPFSVASNGLDREGLIHQCAPPDGALNETHRAAIPSLLGAIIYHRALNYVPVGIEAIRVSREQLKRINPSYTFAELTPAPPRLAGAQVMSV